MSLARSSQRSGQVRHTLGRNQRPGRQTRSSLEDPRLTGATLVFEGSEAVPHALMTAHQSMMDVGTLASERACSRVGTHEAVWADGLFDQLSSTLSSRSSPSPAYDKRRSGPCRHESSSDRSSDVHNKRTCPTLTRPSMTHTSVSSPSSRHC